MNKGMIIHNTVFKKAKCWVHILSLSVLHPTIYLFIFLSISHIHTHTHIWGGHSTQPPVFPILKMAIPPTKLLRAKLQTLS